MNCLQIFIMDYLQAWYNITMFTNIGWLFIYPTWNKEHSSVKSLFRTTFKRKKKNLLETIHFPRLSKSNILKVM